MARPAASDERVIIEGPESIRNKIKSAWADGTHSLLFTPSEFLERLVALIPTPKFHTTRNYGVLASRSPNRRYLPDKPKRVIDAEQDPASPSESSPDKVKKTGRWRRILWAQPLKCTFKIDVLKFEKCGGRMQLVAVMFDPPTIATTLRALGIPVRAPPLAPPRSRQLPDCSNSNDWTGADPDYGWPDSQKGLLLIPHLKKLTNVLPRKL
ncbi:MAG: transposase [Silvanigrellaceae bacterium]